MTFEVLYKAFETLFSFEMNFMIPIFFAPVLLWLAFRAHRSNEIVGSSVRSKGSLLIYSSTNVFVAFVWVLVFGENLIKHDSLWFPIFDVAAPLGILLLLFVIPAAIITAWWLGRKEHDSAANKSAYILLSIIFYLISIIPSCLMILFYTGMALGK